VIEWRDSILSGRKCEKFLNIDGKNYAARKVDDYLLVDLSLPISGRGEKYGEGCFGFENYVNKPIQFEDEAYSVGFIYSEFIERLIGDTEYSAYLTFNPSMESSWVYA